MILTINKYPEQEESLRKKCIPVEEITEEIKFFCNSLLETMLVNDGLGLAANQVGGNLRIIALNFGEPFVLINPRIIKTNKIKKLSREGCLSFPEKHFIMLRDQKITVRGLNTSGEIITETLVNLAAFCVQHEIDHLNGILDCDRVLKSAKQ